MKILGYKDLLLVTGGISFPPGGICHAPTRSGAKCIKGWVSLAIDPNGNETQIITAAWPYDRDHNIPLLDGAYFSGNPAGYTFIPYHDVFYWHLEHYVNFPC